MKRILLAAAASGAALVAAAPASAVTYVRDLGTVTVPPDAFFNPDVMASAGTVDAYYNFTLASAFTVSGGNFASSNPSSVSFNNVGIYAGTGTQASTGAPTGTRFTFNSTQTVTPAGNSIGFTPIILQAGTYTIYLSGNASSMNQITSAIRFSSPVPEPATWGLMLTGFGMVGFGLRTRRKASVTFA